MLLCVKNGFCCPVSVSFYLCVLHALLWGLCRGVVQPQFWLWSRRRSLGVFAVKTALDLFSEVLMSHCVSLCVTVLYITYTLTALICNGGWKLCIDLTDVNPRKPIHSDRTEVPPLLQASLNILCMVCVVRAACYLTVGCLTSLVFLQ
jgi:hypothetical protein